MNGSSVYILTREQWVDRPLERVFPFCERPENLALITPARLRFRLLTPTPVTMEQGRIIDYTIRVLGEQLQGPYSFWHHTHRFETVGTATHLIDEVRYALPGMLPAPLASALHAGYVKPNLQQIFEYRRTQFEKFFGNATRRDVTAEHQSTAEY